MKKVIFGTLFTIIFIIKAFSNELSQEESPYLLAHKDNPVQWMAWSTRAFEKAKKENKPIFLSIGYATCHWCHVMERDSFSDTSLAQKLNDDFICIKVDREEMPQVDALYQNIFASYYGRTGGWPLSLFMTPQKEVFYITTYIPLHQESYSEGLENIIPKLAHLYKYEKKNLLSSIAKFAYTTERIQSVDDGVKQHFLEELSDSLKENYDEIFSGFGNSKKFPQASKISLMMDIASLRDDAQLRRYSYETLDTMALKGIYDQIEGGFFRYTVDAAWESPHFEKMLYTQAELISLYTRAYLQTKKELYKDVVVETIAMVEKRLMKEHLFYSASDADSEGKEGDYYTFTQDEIEHAGLVFEENFEGKEHIYSSQNRRSKDFITIRKKLLQVREKKSYPSVDIKINTAWNALMIQALYKASVLDAKYEVMADKALQKLQNVMLREGELYHQNIIGLKPKVKGVLEDYSFFIAALLSAYEVGYDSSRLDLAEYLLSQAQEKFYRDSRWYLSDDGVNVEAGLSDKYYASALSIMMQNIIKLAAIKESIRYEKLFMKSMKPLKRKLFHQKSQFPRLAEAYLMYKKQIFVIQSRKQNLKKARKKIAMIEYPYIATKANVSNYYKMCTLRQCFAREKHVETLLQKLNRE